MVCVDSSLIYAANKKEIEVVSSLLEKDSIGIKCIKKNLFITYCEGWENAHSLCITEEYLFVSHQEGIRQVGLEGRAVAVVINLPDEPCVLARFGADILFTNQKRSSVWHLKRCEDIRIFA